MQGRSNEACTGRNQQRQRLIGWNTERYRFENGPSSMHLELRLHRSRSLNGKWRTEPRRSARNRRKRGNRIGRSRHYAAKRGRTERGIVMRLRDQHGQMSLDLQVLFDTGAQLRSATANCSAGVADRRTAGRTLRPYQCLPRGRAARSDGPARLSLDSSRRTRCGGRLPGYVSGPRPPRCGRPAARIGRKLAARRRVASCGPRSS